MKLDGCGAAWLPWTSLSWTMIDKFYGILRFAGKIRRLDGQIKWEPKVTIISSHYSLLESSEFCHKFSQFDEEKKGRC